MDFVSPFLELVKCSWDLASKPWVYICNMNDNVNSLRDATDNLKARSQDVKARVEGEEAGGGVQRTKEVENWLDKVHKFVSGGDQLLREAEERNQVKCLGRCLPPNCCSCYKLGRRVYQMLNEARELILKGEFNVVTLLSGPPRGLEIPMNKTVGFDISLNEVLKWLVDENQGVIGLYGPGGVGKTTLMKRINNELSRANHGFDVVIWVVVSKQVNEDNIRDTIKKRLNIKNEAWEGWSLHERVYHMREYLTQKKFVLLVDDLWESLDLSNIGISRSDDLENGSKVVFTTRLKQVCYQMAADRTLEVQCLMPEEALELFENSAGKSTVHSHPQILEFAKDVVQECKGLPLALITVGRALAGKQNPLAWKHALTILRNNPYKLKGMVEEVYHILGFSYDNLDDSTIKLCFLYCCLFPEDYLIRPHDLIELWIGEGFLGDTDDVYIMRDNGWYVLDSLKLACLLESGRDDLGEERVKMHDVIRDMATWIARDRGQSENKLLVIEKEEDLSAEIISKWGEAEKVSLWGGWIQNIHQTSLECSQLRTLFVRETKVTVVPPGFFDSMTAHLTVLNLSHNQNIQLFPKEICNLSNLQYLNLSSTNIKELPREIKNLTRLRWLLLDDMMHYILIPKGTITRLPLNVFSQWSLDQGGLNVFGQGDKPSGQVKEEEIVKELECMQHLTDLSINVFNSSSILKIFKSKNLQRCIRKAWMTDSQNDLTSIVISYSPARRGGFSHLEELHLSDCPVLRKMEITQGIRRAPNRSPFPSLVTIRIEMCGLSDLSWLVHAPKLKELMVENCYSLEKIIGDGFAEEELAASGLFSHLEFLYLKNIPKLRSICDQTLNFLQEVTCHVLHCPGLRELPVGFKQ